MGQTVSRDKRPVSVIDQAVVRLEVPPRKSKVSNTVQIQTAWDSSQELLQTKRDNNSNEHLDENNNIKTSNDNDHLPTKITPSISKRFSPMSLIKASLSKLLFRKKSSKHMLESSKTNLSPLMSGKSPRHKKSIELHAQQTAFLRPSTPHMLDVRRCCATPITVMQAVITPNTNHPKSTTSKGGQYQGGDIPTASPRLSDSISRTPTTTTTPYPNEMSKDNSTPPPPRSRPPKPPNKRTARERSPFRTGCCGPAAPPVYLDYKSTSCGSSGYGGRGNRWKTGNPIIDRLKNVDVIEELQYNCPESDTGDCLKSKFDDPDFDYFYVCDGCGETMDGDCPCGTGDNSSSKPVTYSRRQRFNFTSSNNAQNDDDDDDGPPFKWPADPNLCCCPCCVAGLRRNPW
jgi:hypothetical protein